MTKGPIKKYGGVLILTSRPYGANRTYEVLVEKTTKDRVVTFTKLLGLLSKPDEEQLIALVRKRGKLDRWQPAAPDTALFEAWGQLASVKGAKASLAPNKGRFQGKQEGSLAEKVDQTVYYLNGITYLPHYTDAGLYARPGQRIIGHKELSKGKVAIYEQLCVTEAALVRAGASASLRFLWERDRS